MSWIVLFIAGLLEVVWAVGLKYTHGFSRLVPSVITHRGDGGQHGAALMGDENPTGRYRLTPSGPGSAPWAPP